MKRLILLFGILVMLGGLAWAEGLKAHELKESPVVYGALRLQQPTEQTSGSIVVYIWDGDCEICDATVASLMQAGVFEQMQRERVNLYMVNLSEDKRNGSAASFVVAHRVARAPTFLFFKDGQLKKRLTAAAGITPESFKSALSLIR